MGTCPVVDKSLIKVPYATTDLTGWYGAIMSNYPEGHRYVADNMWTSACAEELLPGIHRIIDTMPPPPSHFLMFNWSPSAARDDLFYGLEDEINLALYAVWNAGWAACREPSSLTSGSRGLSRARMGAGPDLSQRVHGDKGVDLRGGDRCVAEQLLHHTDVRAAVE